MQTVRAPDGRPPAPGRRLGIPRVHRLAAPLPAHGTAPRGSAHAPDGRADHARPVDVSPERDGGHRGNKVCDDLLYVAICAHCPAIIAGVHLPLRRPAELLDAATTAVEWHQAGRRVELVCHHVSGAPNAWVHAPGCTGNLSRN